MYPIALDADQFTEIKKLIQTELAQVRQRIEEVLSAPDEQIQKCLEYLTASPGKMLRPALVLLQPTLQVQEAPVCISIPKS